MYKARICCLKCFFFQLKAWAWTPLLQGHKEHRNGQDSWRRIPEGSRWWRGDFCLHSWCKRGQSLKFSAAGLSSSDLSFVTNHSLCNWPETEYIWNFRSSTSFTAIAILRRSASHLQNNLMLWLFNRLGFGCHKFLTNIFNRSVKKNLKGLNKSYYLFVWEVLQPN